jgi:prepilin-type N-terminal cleavage/methylation domain-containing protein
MRARRIGRAREAGFTLLELLLALMILSLGAALAFPRISDAYQGIRVDRLTKDAARLVHEAGRSARLGGAPMLLNWSREQHSLIIARADRSIDVAVRLATPRNPWLEPDPTPAEIARLLGWDAPGAPLPGAVEDHGKPTARLAIDRDIEVQAIGLPLLIDEDGRSGGARILFQKDGRTVSDLAVSSDGSTDSPWAKD